jgi:pimeloyl-ACP methyl ester carboxylesterase
MTTSTMTTRTITVAGIDGPIDLAIAEAGAGGRPLLLVHGFTGAKEDFTDWLEPLAELGWHAVAPDQRGHGASAKPDAELSYSFDHFATDLLGLIDALGWSSTVVLGHSMGGMVVQTAILRSPGRFGGLVLMDTSHRALRADPALMDLAAALALSDGMAAVLAAQQGIDPEEAPLGNAAHERLLATRPGYREFGERKLLASSPWMYAAMLRVITGVTPSDDRLDALGSVQVPALVLVGDQDAPFLKPSRRMAEAIPGARLVVVPDGGHSPQFEAPEAWWAALSGFLAELPARAG